MLVWVVAIATAQVSVTLKQVGKLRLVSTMKEFQMPGKMLRGKLVVTLENVTDAQVALIVPDVHGLVFTATATGEDHVVVHSCECVESVWGRALPSHHVVLAPKERRELVLDDWGCESPWPAPPPGKYRVRYRAWLDGKRPHVRPRKLANCEATLVSPELWRDALTSNTIDVAL